MIFIVKGMAAGGTSAIMRVMIEGGIDGYYTKFRPDDQLEILHNPYGTFEMTGPQIQAPMDERENKVCKVFPPNVIARYPEGFEYKIINITRPCEHICQSRNERSIRRKKGSNQKLTVDKLEERKYKQQHKLKEIVAKRKDMQMLTISYVDLCEDTEKVVKQIADFVKPHTFNIQKAIAAVDKKLYIKRTKSGEAK